jgi:hypothetical protein
MYCDAADSDINPNNIDCKEFTCKAGDIITLDMVGSGGAALQFIPTPNL